MSEKVNLHYTVAGEKDKSPVLFLHGFMGSSADWEQVITGLSDKYYCVAADLPGHGQTIVHDENDYSMEATAASVVELLDELEISRTSLVGYSMGGRLAIYLGINYPDRFKSLIIESASPGLKTNLERQVRIEQDWLVAERLLNVPLEQFVEDWYGQALFASIDRNQDAYRELVKRRLRNDPEKLNISLRMIGAGSQPPLWGDLGRIKSPMLLMVGRHDAKFRRIAADIVDRCPVASAIIIDSAGHNIHFENRSEFIRQIIQFLENIGKDTYG